MKSILTILTAASLLALGACSTKTSSSTSSCCAAGKEKACTDGQCTVDGHKHTTAKAKTTKKKE